MAINKAKALAAADKHIAKQNFNKALNELLKVVKIAPNDTTLLNKIGDLYSKLGKKRDAIKYFTKVAESYQKGGFNLKAIALYKKVTRIDPRYMDARDRMVNLYMQQGHLSEAKGELRKMAEFYYKENLFARALTCYEKLVEIDSSNLDARIKITELLMREGRREDAIQHFIVMARELLEKNMLHEAQKIVGQGLKIDTRHPGLLVLLSQTYIAEGKVDEALTQLTEICRENENDLNALRILGKTYLDRGQLRDANACFIRALHLSEEETSSAEEVARQFIKKGNLDEAYGALVHVSDIYLSRGDYEDAIRLFRSILYSDENHLPSLEMLVRIYEDAQQISNAVLTIEKIINYYKARGENERVVELIIKLLELEPNNREWRARLETMEGMGRPRPGEEVTETQEKEKKEKTESQAFEDEGMAFEDAALPALDSSVSQTDLGLAPQDPATQIANHLTDADMAMNYKLFNQAVEHLTAVKQLDLLNVEANSRLKMIFMEKNEVEKAVGCMVCLTNAYLEEKQFEKAGETIDEIKVYRPDIAQIHKGRLESMLLEESRKIDAAGEFDLHIEPETSKTSGAIVFESDESQDVVDFRELNRAPENEEPQSETDEGGWSLDMPTMSKPASTAQDMSDLYMADEDNYSLDFKSEEEERPSPAKETFEIIEPEEEDIKFTDFAEEDIPVPQKEVVAPTDFAEEDIPVPQKEVVAPTDFAEEELSVTEEELEAIAEIEEPGTVGLDEEVTPEELPEEALEEITEELSEELPEELTEELPEEPPEARVPEVPKATPEVAIPQRKDVEERDLSFLDQVEEEETSQTDTFASVGGHAPLGTEQGSLFSELEEIDFFISVEAFDDARNLIKEAFEQFGEHPLIMERQNEVQDKTQAADRRRVSFDAVEPPVEKEEEDLLGKDAGGFFDLAAELNEELFAEEEAGKVVNDNVAHEEIQTVEELFQEFKKGVDEQIDEKDHQTHYDLGIAYKEMGLLDEAIGEFEKAQQGEGRLLECSTMIGNCLIELGRMDSAVDYYETTIEQEGVREDERVVLSYELGRAYEGNGETDKALQIFLKIRENHGRYRDLDERIEALD